MNFVRLHTYVGSLNNKMMHQQTNLSHSRSKCILSIIHNSISDYHNNLSGNSTKNKEEKKLVTTQRSNNNAFTFDSKWTILEEIIDTMNRRNIQ